jgi:hypothetical protein
MVFHMKKAYNSKKLVTKMIISLFIISALLFSLVQVFPVFAQEEYGASFTGTFSDEGVDMDDDGSYEYLRLSIEVNVTTAGRYTIDAGGLYDANNDYVVVSDNKTLNLDVGINIVDIDLSGEEIFSSEINPTTVASIYLYNETGDTIDSLYDEPLSTVYSYSQFNRPSIVIEFSMIKRTIMLDQDGIITMVDSYTLTNLGFRANQVTVGIPEGAYNIEVRDEMGTLETSTENNMMTVTFRDDVETDKIETIYIDYHMPWDELVSQQNGDGFTLHFTFYEQFNSTVGKLLASITLPKGAELESSNPVSNSKTKQGIQETISFSFSNVEPSQDLSFSVNYKYLVFWGSFYPTIWVGLVVIVGTAVFFLFGKPKTVSAPAILVDSKELKSFIDAYEEKATVRQELEDLEERLQKGKIPRRRYKVRRKMLEGRLTAISRKLSKISETLRTGGSKYSSLLRQIELSEAKLEGAQRDMERIKARYSRGEVSKGAYGKLLEEYQNRIDEAEAAIEGVLLSIRD